MLLALGISLACGFLGWVLGLPLPWMLGPMIGNTIAAMLALPIRGPDKLRPYVMPIIGVMLGSAITSDVFGQIGNWILTLVLLPIALAFAAMLSYAVYRRVGQYDPVTAFYSAMPGGMNEMMLMGAEKGGSEKRIALAHAARVLIVIFFVVLYFGYALGVTSTGQARWIGLNALSVQDYAILTTCAVTGVWLGKALRLPAGPVFGPMILSGIAHVAGWVTVAPPTLLVITAQLIIGTVIGARFVGAKPGEIARDLGLAALASLMMLGVAVVFAEVVAFVSGMALAQAFLAYAPGGLTEMSLLTLAMRQDVTYVSVMHLIRIMLVIAVAPLVFRATARFRS